jgi:hypothetical protein
LLANAFLFLTASLIKGKYFQWLRKGAEMHNQAGLPSPINGPGQTLPVTWPDFPVGKKAVVSDSFKCFSIYLCGFKPIPVFDMWNGFFYD